MTTQPDEECRKLLRMRNTAYKLCAALSGLLMPQCVAYVTASALAAYRAHGCDTTGDRVPGAECHHVNNNHLCSTNVCQNTHIGGAMFCCPAEHPYLFDAPADSARELITPPPTWVKGATESHYGLEYCKYQCANAEDQFKAVPCDIIQHWVESENCAKTGRPFWQRCFDPKDAAKLREQCPNATVCSRDATDPLCLDWLNDDIVGVCVDPQKLTSNFCKDEQFAAHEECLEEVRQYIDKIKKDESAIKCHKNSECNGEVCYLPLDPSETNVSCPTGVYTNRFGNRKGAFGEHCTSHNSCLSGKCSWWLKCA